VFFYNWEKDQRYKKIKDFKKVKKISRDKN